jgi:hypothetical protein
LLAIAEALEGRMLAARQRLFTRERCAAQLARLRADGSARGLERAPQKPVPSQLHEALLLLFRNRPTLAPGLLREALRIELPSYTEARIEAADLTDVEPAEYRADLVVMLYDRGPVLGLIVEVQLGIDERKRFAWPMHAAGLRARTKCPVCVLVVTADDSVARWASKDIDLGGSNRFRPLVLGPAIVPEVTDELRAKSDPELAVLSAMAHGRDRDTDKAQRIAVAALSAAADLDPDRIRLYLDLVLSSLSEAARRSFGDMHHIDYEYQSDFARKYFYGGQAAVVLKLLQLKFGPLSDELAARVRAGSPKELDTWTERVLTASTVDEVLR